jgi:hypothetical protein
MRVHEMDMDIKNLPPSMQLIFMAMMKSAIIIKEIGKDKSFFVDFAQEIWNSMEMSDLATLKDIIDGKMRDDIEPYVQKYMKSRKNDVR